MPIFDGIVDKFQNLYHELLVTVPMLCYWHLQFHESIVCIYIVWYLHSRIQSLKLKFHRSRLQPDGL